MEQPLERGETVPTPMGKPRELPLGGLHGFVTIAARAARRLVMACRGLSKMPDRNRLRAHDVGRRISDGSQARGQAIMAHEYLADLNTEQRHAVEHGIDAECATTAPPLLVIAGAGSGKTKTLAHRVAHLVVNGVDPHRILLLTFTRRAAEEMIRRVKRITATALGTQQRPRRLTMVRITSVPRSNG